MLQKNLPVNTPAHSGPNSLATRKQLLIAESEINRLYLVQECQKAKSLSSLAFIPAVAALFSGLAGWRDHLLGHGSRSSWWPTAVKAFEGWQGWFKK